MCPCVHARARVCVCLCVCVLLLLNVALELRHSSGKTEGFRACARFNTQHTSSLSLSGAHSELCQGCNFCLIIYYKPRPRNYRVLHRALYNPRPQAEGCMRGVKPDNFEAEACNIFKFFRLLSSVIEALSTSFFRRRKTCGE